MDAQFAEFARLHQRRLRRAAFLVCGDADTSDDLVQQALIKLARHWPRVRDQQPEAYIRRIIYNEAVSSWRRTRREQLTSDGQLPQLVAVDESIRSPGADVRAALATLSPQQRAVIVLRYFEDLTEADTAAVLGISVGSVKTQASRALTKLRNSLSSANIEPEPS